MLISFYPAGKKQAALKGETLSILAAKAEVAINADCAGQGNCGKCKVKILSGYVGLPDRSELLLLTKEELNNNIRLACRVKIQDDMAIEVLPVADSVGNRKKNLARLPADFIPDTNEWKPGEPEAYYGLAFDIGTTTVVGMLWNMYTAELAGAVTRTNPQSVHGSDVISRIMYCGMAEENLKKMQQLIIACLNEIIQELVSKHGILTESIKKVTLVGNTTMGHLLLGIDPKGLAITPFSPGFTGSVSLKAKDLDLQIHKCASVDILPNIAGHLGSDIVAVELSSGIKEMKETNLVVDIGTNGEILLAYAGEVLACSTAAGPAFEGACIQYGMRASDGAIEGVSIREDRVELSVIGDVKPMGICGSGLIDCVAELLKAGMITDTGKLLTIVEARETGIPEQLAKRLITGDKGNSFLLYSDGAGINIMLTQKDIREVQLAKAAILSGIRILMKELKLEDKASALDNILLAGAFGNYIKKESALRIGLLPDIPLNKVISIGNAAGTGASMALLSKAALNKANQLAEETRHIELANHPDFQAFYLDSMSFNRVGEVYGYDEL